MSKASNGPIIGANKVFNFTLGESYLKLHEEFKYCSAGNNWKCQDAHHYWIKEHSLSLIATLVPRKTGQGSINPWSWWYVRIKTYLDFSLQDTWLDMIVQEQPNPHQHIFETHFGSTTVNTHNLVVVNKLYPVKHTKPGESELDLLLYSYFSKFENKDLTIRVNVKSTLHDWDKRYSVTNQIWSDLIILSVNNPGYEVSLRGSILVELTNIADNVSTVLKAYWTVDSAPQRNSEYCPLQGVIYKLYNFMRFHKINDEYHQYYYTVSQFRYPYTSNKNLHSRQVSLNAPSKTKRLGSWNEANRTFNSSGTYLPVFRGKEEQDEFIRYLKFVRCTPTVNILYIGLTVNLVRY